MMEAPWQKRVLPVVAITVVLVWATLVNLTKTRQVLGERKTMGGNSDVVFRSVNYGNSALLGKMLRQWYPPDSHVVIADPTGEEWAKYYSHGLRINQCDIACFAYPVRVTMAKYDCLLDEKVFNELRRAAERSTRANNAFFYLVGTRGGGETMSELMLFAYRDNVIIVPRDRVLRHGN